MANRWDETWHRLRDWTNGQAQSERLATQVLSHEGFRGVDPSHPLGGPDGGKDAICFRGAEPWSMAVYFPRGQQTFAVIKNKFLVDLQGAEEIRSAGIAFVTNQELSLSARQQLLESAKGIVVELFHLERITAILDTPEMESVRAQFLSIDFGERDLIEKVAALESELSKKQSYLQSLQTGGDTFCYWMLYWFDLERALAKQFVVIKHGVYPLFNLGMRIVDLETHKDIYRKSLGEMNAPAVYMPVQWKLRSSLYYRVFFDARNGFWNQDLILRRSESANCWLAATKVRGDKTSSRFEHLDNGFAEEFGAPDWR